MHAVPSRGGRSLSGGCVARHGRARFWGEPGPWRAWHSCGWIAGSKGRRARGMSRMGRVSQTGARPSDGDVWARYAASRRKDEGPRGRVYWDWYQRYGPGAEVLGELDGRSVVDLGAGTGRVAAHLAEGWGAERVWAVDSSEESVRLGRQRFGEVPGVTFVRAEATGWLTARPGSVDVAYSAFGAADFTDPYALLPAVAEALRPGGKLLIATLGHFHSGEPPHDDVRPVTIPVAEGAVQRWVLAMPVWERLLTDHGFTDVTGRLINDSGPAGRPPVATVLLLAERPGNPRR
ncbi:class I SAM-dependent methyltransferase [Streptomyces sp. NPDC093221]|uniref:class I SAM-dependent methyltransferase n=1 Tax=Streptomyces sp. NPDC093221 TaxID=3366032 RepID=UPI00380081D6